MNTIRNMVGGLAFALAIGGCEPTDTTKAYTRPEVFEKVEEQKLDKLPTETKTLEGRIIKVQPSIINFGGGEIAGPHEFIYVVVKDKSNKNRILFYPYSKAIIEGEAKISYISLPSERIDTHTFIKTFINPNYRQADVFQIEAEGFIVPKGIEYKETQ